MAALDLYHHIYTHAPSQWHPAGGRFAAAPRDAAMVLPETTLRDLKDLMVKLVPEGQSPAWAMRRFSSETDRFACVIVAYRGIDDAADRDGTIKHARLVRLDPDEPWFNPVPLIDAVNDFPIKDVWDAPPDERLRRYLDLIADDATINVPPLSVPALNDMPRPFLQDVIAVILTLLGEQKAARVEAGSETVAPLALAAAGLPAALQQQSSWALDAAAGVPVDVVFTPSGRPPAEVAKEGARSCAASYLKLLLDTPYDLKPLMSDDAIRTAVDLQQFVQKTAIATPTEKREMSKDKNKNKPPASRLSAQPEAAGFDDDTLRGLDRQQRAIYDSLRKYIDERLKAYEIAHDVAPAPAPAPAAGQATPVPARAPVRTAPDAAAVPGNRRLVMAIAAAAAVTAAMIFGGQWAAEKYAGWKQAQTVVRTDTGASGQQKRQDDKEQQQQRRSSPNLLAVQQIIADAEAAARAKQELPWANGLKRLSEQRPQILAAVLKAAAGAQDVEAPVRAEFDGFRDRLDGNGAPVDSDARNAVRPLLFEYMVKQLAEVQIVDGKLDDIDETLLSEAKTQWNVTSATNDVNDRELQAELILRWIEEWAK